MSSLELKWEAEHPEDAGFCGGWLEPGEDRIFMAYAGEVKTKGALMWTKNHLESPAEVVAISLSSDEPVWSAELGGDVDLTPLVADEVYRAMRPRVLGKAGSTVLVAVLFQPDVWDLYGLDCSTGEALWTTRCKEPFTHHIDVEAEQIWTCSEGGIVSVRGVRTGESVTDWNLNVDDFQCLTAEGDAFLYRAEARCLIRLSPGQNDPVWSTAMEATGIDNLTDRVVVQKDHVFCLESGHLRAVSREAGQILFEASTHEGDQLFLTEAAGRVFVQDVLGGNLSVYSGETGTAVLEEELPELLYWGENQGGLVATSIEGALLTESEPGALTVMNGGDGWRILEVAPRDGGLLGMALQGEEESPSLHVVQVNPGGDSPIVELAELSGTEVATLMVKDQHVIVSTALGFKVFA